MMKLNNRNNNNNSTSLNKHSIDLPSTNRSSSNKQHQRRPGCELEREQETIKSLTILHDVCFRPFQLVKLCNLILISYVMLFCIINGSAATSLGCSSNPCIFGVCIDDLNGSYSCYCIDGYTGRQCQTNWDECWSAPCLNGGTCIDGVASYNCTCSEGFNGINCEENLDECLSNPCLNGGTCDDRNNGYVCSCPSGYAGINCELDVAVCDTGNGDKCHNGGVCVEGRGLDFTCECADGWTGRFCSINVDECESSPCLNGGVCIDKIAGYACSCAKEFTGPNCEENIKVCNDSPCQNSALCLMEEGQPICYCVPDFHGEKCEYQYDECQIGPRCQNDGQCVDGVDDFVCKCRNEFKGMFCECMQNNMNGELDCNYTMIDKMRTTTARIGEFEFSTETNNFLTTLSDFMTTTSATTTMRFEESTSSFPSSITTEIVPMTSKTDSTSTANGEESSSSTIEVLDLSKSTTTETYESSSERIEISSRSTTESTMMEISSSTEQISTTPIDTSSSSLSSIFTTRTPITRTTKLRPCPPDMTRPPTSTKPSSSTVRSSETSTMTSPADFATTSSFGVTSSSYETSSSSMKIDEMTSTSTVAYTTSMSTESSWVSIPSTSLSSEISSTFNAITSLSSNEVTETTTSTSTLEPEISSSTSVGGAEFTTTTTEVIQSHEKSTTEIDKTSMTTTVTSDETSTSSTFEVTSTSNPAEISTSTTLSSSASFKPTESSSSSSSTDEMFTLTPNDVTSITSTSSSSSSNCEEMKCYNGGLCEETRDGPKCICRFDRQDPQCRTQVRVKNAAFAGDSYLSHKIYSEKDKQQQDETSEAKNLNKILSIKVEMKARTRATDGLILLATAQGPKGGHYTALFLHKGLLQFQFSCGLQTMLLSELEAPINTGHEFSIQVALDFSGNHSHCNASLRINDTLAMSGDQPTWLGLKSLGKSKTIDNVWLHLGGSPQTPVVLMSELPGGQGFTGCLHTLKINGNSKEIFRDASDGFGITECGSLACLANPCRNGGTCEEKLMEHHDMENDINQQEVGFESLDSYENRWTCKCPTGYLGLTCEKSVCENNPCHFGGTCVEFPGSGYLCLCPLGKHGHYCEHNLDVDQPSFSGSINGLSSYISYPVPIPLETTLDLSFRITPSTAAQISLLAFLGQSGLHDDKSDHLALSYIQGYVMLTWNLGSGPRRIFTQRPLEFKDDEDEIISYHVQVIRQGRTASLYIDGKLNVTGNSPGDVARLDVVPMLYIGGHSLTNFTTLPHDLPLHSGFQGCIYNLQLKSGPLVVPLHETKGIFGRGVGQCGTRECHKHSCHNNGACLQHGSTYTCICPDGWFGTLCNQRMNPCDNGNHKCAEDSTCVPLINGYECDCRLGKGGRNCETEIKYLSDVSLNGKRSYFALRWPNHTQFNANSRDRYRARMRASDVDVFNYDTSIKLMAKNIMEYQRKAQLFSMEFQLRPLSESGLLMFLGDLGDRNDGFISLSITGGVLEFRISGRQGQLSIVKSNRVLAIGEWHKIRMSQNGRRLSLWVEGVSSTNLLQQNTVFYHNYNSLIYVGGLPDISMLPSYAISGFPIPFKGCVRQFHLNGFRYVLNEQTIAESRNINDCDGTACGGDSCDLGGNCYLDDKSNPHCKCPETSKGVHCEIPESCTVIQCKNNGKCLASGQCSCPNGWTGFFCEIATNKFSLPSFNGKSYMIVPSQRLTHKDKRNRLSSQYNNRAKFVQLSMNISTINTNGLLLWSDNNEGDYLGIGLENGFLKLVSNLMNFTNEEIDIPSGGYLSDGGWHNIKLDADEKGQIALVIDHKLIYNEVHSSEKNSNLDHIGGSFFVGGFPLDTSISNRTMNHFYKPFSGCLQGIQITSFNGLTTKTSSIQNSNPNEPNYQDFTAYEGENIGECDLFDEFVNSNNAIIV